MRSDRDRRRVVPVVPLLSGIAVGAIGMAIWLQVDAPVGADGEQIVLAELDETERTASSQEAAQPGAVTATGSDDDPVRDAGEVDAPSSDRPAPAAEAQAPDPTAIRIPSLGVDSTMIPLAVDAETGVLEVPESPHVTGWWRDGPEPGEAGAAVVVGHVDSWEGPGVFYRLRDVAAGAELVVEREDGTSVTYSVTRVEQHSKGAFPTDDVYGRTEAPTLRLVTCGGPYDPVEKSYEDNVIVFAELISS